MKKLYLLIAVIVVSFFVVSCDKDNVLPENNDDKYAHYEVFVSTHAGSSVSFSVIADPPTDYNDVDLGYFNDEDLASEKFKLPLKKYKGKTIEVIVYSTVCYSDHDCELKKTLVVEDHEGTKHLQFNF